MALNAKLNRKNHERQAEKDDSERHKREDTVALNAKIETDNGSEDQNWRDGSERRTRVNYGSERRN